MQLVEVETVDMIGSWALQLAGCGHNEIGQLVGDYGVTG